MIVFNVELGFTATSPAGFSGTNSTPVPFTGALQYRQIAKLAAASGHAIPAKYLDATTKPK